MSITQQYALDVYRAARTGTSPPPAPGTHDWRTVRELREGAARAGWPRRLVRSLRGSRESQTRCA